MTKRRIFELTIYLTIAVLSLIAYLSLLDSMIYKEYCGYLGVLSMIFFSVFSLRIPDKHI